MKQKLTKFVDMLNKLCDKGIQLCIIIILFILPFYYDLRVNGTYDISKAIWLHRLVIPIIGLWALKILILNKTQFIRTPLDIWVGIFFLISCMATIFSVSPMVSLFGFYKHFEGLSTIVVYTVLFFAVTNFIHSSYLIRWLMKIIVFTGIISALIGLSQHLKYNPITKGPCDPDFVAGVYGSSVFLSVLLIMTFLLTFMLYLEDTKVHKINIIISRVKKKGFLRTYWSAIVRTYQKWMNSFLVIQSRILPWYYGIGAILIYICFMLTKRRATYLGLAMAGIPFFFFIWRRHLWRSWIRLWLMIFILTTLTVYYNLRPETTIVDRFTSIFKKDISTAHELISKKESRQSETFLSGISGTRKWIWSGALKIIKNYPLLGIGPDTMILVYPRFRSIEMIIAEEGYYGGSERAHCELLDVAMTRGIPGLIVYLIILVSFFFYVWKASTKLPKEGARVTVALSAALLAYIGQSLVSVSGPSITTNFWVFLAMGIVAVGQNKKVTFCWPRGQIFKGVSIISFLVLLSFLWTTMKFLNAAYTADIWYRDGEAYRERGDLLSVAASYEHAVGLNPYQKWYYESLIKLYLDLAISSETERLMWAGKALPLAERSAKNSPCNAVTLNLLGSAYYLSGGKDAVPKAIKAYEQALYWDPNLLDAYHNLGQLYVTEGRYDEACVLYKEGFKKQPWIYRYIHGLAQTYHKMGKEDMAMENLLKIVKEDPYYDRMEEVRIMLGDLYTQKAQVNKAIEEYKEAIKLMPDSVRAHSALGNLYYRKNMLTETIIEFEQVARLMPNDPGIYRDLGSVYYQKGLYPQAKTALERVLAIKGDDPYVKDLLRRIL